MGDDFARRNGVIEPLPLELQIERVRLALVELRARVNRLEEDERRRNR